jgi:hypothetical protein
MDDVFLFLGFSKAIRTNNKVNKAVSSAKVFSK